MQHQAYQPILPSANKYLQYRWDKNCYEMHRNKVKSAKSGISTTPPRTYGHLMVKLKKQQLEEERVSRITRENLMLLDKMSHIMKTAGGVACKNDYVKKSLGRDKRQLELLDITKENQRILQRLSTCRSQYSVQVWRYQWLENVQFRENITRYPRHYTQGSFLPPISADRHGKKIPDRVKTESTGGDVNEEPGEKTKSEDMLATCNEA